MCLIRGRSSLQWDTSLAWLQCYKALIANVASCRPRYPNLQWTINFWD